MEEKDDIKKEITLLEQSANTVGQPIKILKDKSSLEKLFDNTINPCSALFLRKSKLMNRFYFNTSYAIYVNKTATTNNEDQVVKLAREAIKDNTNRIFLQYSYLTFNQVGFQEFTHHSKITFEFKLTKYNVTNDSGVNMEKL